MHAGLSRSLLMPLSTGMADGDQRTREQWQGTLGLGSGFSHLERGPAYPGIAESDPVLHPVPKGLKAQIGVITEVVGHAHVLPPTILDLEQLKIEKWREEQVPQRSVCRKDLELFGRVRGRNMGDLRTWVMFRGEGSQDAGC